MKKLFFLIVIFICFSCSDNNIIEINDSPYIPADLSEYELPDCDGFVIFSNSITGSNSLLLHLRALGYDLDNDGKISCSEAENIIELDLFNDLRIDDLSGIEGLINLKKIYGTVNMNGKTANFYNNLNLEEINFNVGSTTGIQSHISNIVLPNSNSLKIINCSRTQVYKLLNINNQINLETLNMRQSGLTASDGNLDLTNCVNLVDIDLHNCRLAKVTLGFHEFLKNLNISNQSPDFGSNRLRNLNLMGLPNLEHLNVNFNYNIDNLNLTNNFSTRQKI